MGFISKKKKNVNCTVNEFLSQILEIFEEKLEELDITLPDRSGKENLDEARIYGSNYYDLEDKIIYFISINKKQLSKVI